MERERTTNKNKKRQQKKKETKQNKLFSPTKTKDQPRPQSIWYIALMQTHAHGHTTHTRDIFISDSSHTKWMSDLESNVLFVQRLLLNLQTIIKQELELHFVYNSGCAP